MKGRKKKGEGRKERKKGAHHEENANGAAVFVSLHPSYREHIERPTRELEGGV